MNSASRGGARSGGRGQQPSPRPSMWLALRPFWCVSSHPKCCSRLRIVMSTGDSRQRRLHQSNNVRDDDHQQEEEEEQSIIKGLLPCIIGIVGVALAIWLGVYLYLPPQNPNAESDITYHSVLDSSHGSDLVCTQVENLQVLDSDLESVIKWERLGQALRVDQSVLAKTQADAGAEQDKTKKILRTWFESGNDLCWEEVIQSLKEIGMPALANQLALKYHLTKG